MRIQDIMTRDVATIGADADATDAWNEMKARAIHHLVVKDGPRVVGVVSERDLGGARGPRQGTAVATWMARHPVCVAPKTTVRQAAARMKARSIGSLLAMDGDELVGIVTVSDLLDLLGRGTEKPTHDRDRPTQSRPPEAWHYPRSGGSRPRGRTRSRPSAPRRAGHPSK